LTKQLAAFFLILLSQHTRGVMKKRQPMSRDVVPACEVALLPSLHQTKEWITPPPTVFFWHYPAN
jgi:hypothetical protein